MSYTNVELIRHHIEYIQPVNTYVRDQQITIDSDNYIKFHNGGIESQSVVVKSIRDFKQSCVSLSLTNGNNQLSNSPIVPGSLVCGSDNSLGTIYTENLDFIIDYTDGTLMIKAGGNLSPGMNVVVCFIPFFLYVENYDYRIDVDSGELQKIISGAIQTGETVFIDYKPIYQNYGEEILQNAVTEANAIIEMLVDPKGEFGANLVLQSAATYRALEIICRSSAARELISHTKNDRTAQAWMKLAESYHIRSNELMKTFIEPVSGPIPPTHS